MQRRFLRRLPGAAGLALAALALLSGPALAQEALCQRYRAELAALPQSGGGAEAAEAGRQRAELGRLHGQYRSLGCDRGETFFFTPPQRQCAALAVRIEALQTQYARFAGQVDPYGQRVEERRRQLRAAVEYYCRPRNSPLDDIAGFFGFDRPRPQVDPGPVERGPEGGPDGAPGGRPLGGGRLVCVRACDGFWFPISTQPSGNAGPDELCQALCPAADTAAYRAPHGDGDIGQAVSLKGEPYTQLPGAFRFRKRVDPSCTCRRPDQSWAEALRSAEQMIEQRNDVVVTAERAEELSRPRANPPPTAPTSTGRPPREPGTRQQAARNGAPQQPPPQQAPLVEPPSNPAEVPTAGGESSGIGPQTITGDQPLGREAGRRQEMTTDRGTRRSVRVIDPQLRGAAPP